MPEQVPYTPFPQVQPQGVRVPQGTAGQAGAVATGIGSIGKGIGSAAQDQAAVEFKRWGLQDELIANDANTSALRGASNLLSNFELLKGEAANKALPKFQDDMQALYEDSLAKMPNLNTQTMLSGSMQYTLSYYNRYARQHADSELSAWHNTSANAATDQYAVTAIVAATRPGGVDYRALDASLAGAIGERTKLYEMEGYSEDDINVLTRADASKVISQVITSAYDADPNRAEELYNKYGPALKGVDQINILNKLRTFDNNTRAASDAGDIARGMTPSFKSSLNAPSPTSIGPVGAPDVISHEEGFNDKPFIDSDGAYRIGYGSDYVTHADGSIERVTANTAPITVADADRDLARQSPQYAAASRATVGEAAWDKLPDNVKSALTSVAYNYGSLTNLHSVVAAVQSGDINKIADAVENLGNAPGINNPERRSREASIIRGSIDNPAQPVTDPVTGATAPQGSSGLAGQQVTLAQVTPSNVVSFSQNIPGASVAGAKDQTLPSQNIDPNTGLIPQDEARQKLIDYYDKIGRPDLIAQALTYQNDLYTAKNAAFSDWQHAQEQTKAKEDQGARTAEQEYIGAMNNPNAPPNLRQMILQDPRLGGINSSVPTETKNRLLAAMDGGAATTARSNSTVSDFVRRLGLPDGDPKKLTDLGELYTAMANNQLNQSGFNFVYGLVNGSKTQEGQNLATVRTTFLKSVTSRVTGSDLGLGRIDPVGDDNLYKLTWDLSQAEAQARADHKDPLSIYDPKSSNYVGNLATKYIRPLSQVIEDSISTFTGNTVAEDQAVIAAGGTPKPKPPTVPSAGPNAIQQFFGAPPSDLDKIGKAVGETGAALQLLAPSSQPAQPSPTAPQTLPSNPDDFLNQILGVGSAKGAEAPSPSVRDMLAKNGAYPADLTGPLALLISQTDQKPGELDSAYRKRVSTLLGSISAADFSKLNVLTKLAITRLRADFGQ